MRTIFNQTSKNLLLLFAAILLITACKKEEEPTLDPPRLFKASDISITAGQTSAKIKWGVPLFSSGKPLNYTVDFSTTAAFTTVAYSKVVDTAGITVTEDNLTIRTPYYVRIKANAFENQPESKYIVGTSAVTITGTQLFLQLQELEIRETAITLHFVKDDATLNSIKLTPATGTPITVSLTAADRTAGLKVITGLTGGVKYTAQIYAGTKDKGLLEFTTLPVTNYTLVISPTDNLATTIAAAANGAIIGLNPGTYTLSVATFITGKTITLKSTSGTPTDTKVNFKEIDLEGTGAGITVSGIEFDGTTPNAAYFINLIGSQANNGSAAVFTNVVVDNCIVHAANTSFFRGSRGTVAADQKINAITVTNSIIYDMGVNSSAAYYTFHLDNLEFKTLTVTKSTLYNSGAGLFLASKTIASTIPTVIFSYCTINGFGGATKYALFDVAANPVNFTLTNSIVTNTPKSGTVQAAAFRSTGTGANTTISYTNMLNLFGTGTTPLTLPVSTTTNPYVIIYTSNYAVDLFWNVNTVPPGFQLPAGSPLKTASNISTAIGDPRWTY